MHQFSFIIAAAASIGVVAIGFVKGTYAAGGSDSSCYVLMAETFASGHLQPRSALASQVPWPHPARTFTPGGFEPSGTNPSAFSPICAPGFSFLLARVVALAGLDAVFWVTPLVGGLLVWLAFVAGRALGGSLSGAMSAMLTAASPPVLYQVVQPMNDIATTALWMGTFAGLIHRRWALAGVCCGLGLLVRPNLLPLAIVCGAYAYVVSGVSRTVIVAAGALPFALIVLWLNNALYGGPLRTGYGQAGNLFSLSFVPTNVSNYFRWLIETHTPLPLIAFAAPLVIEREKRPETLLGLGLIAATGFIYFSYTPFDDWSYLRFLLPAIALMLVLAGTVLNVILQYVVSGSSRTVIAMVVTIALAVFCVRAATERHAFALQSLEQRYRSAGKVVRDHLPPGAVVLSVWDSGAVRFHGRKEALSWEALEPPWLDRSLEWLETHGHIPYILVESWEEPGFRSRFGAHSDIGKLDWPPKYEIDRAVRIYDPHDRSRYHRGDRVDTEFLWPLRD